MYQSVHCEIDDVMYFAEAKVFGGEVMMDTGQPLWDVDVRDMNVERHNEKTDEFEIVEYTEQTKMLFEQLERKLMEEYMSEEN